jgi:hypothetical protein
MQAPFDVDLGCSRRLALRRRRQNRRQMNDSANRFNLKRALLLPHISKIAFHFMPAGGGSPTWRRVQRNNSAA